MRLLAISDLHLNFYSQDRNQLFLRFLQQALRDCDEVVIVGDLFDLWLGWRQLTFSYQRPILERMQELAANGLRIDYVEGNRDYGATNYRGSIFRNVSALGMLRNWGSQKVYFEHGDLINTRDRQYRAWRQLSKNPVSLWLLGHLPAVILLRMANSLEKGMKRSNLKYKTAYPESEVRNFYQHKANQGSTIIVVGHFHEERKMVLPNHDRSVLCYNLPGWETGFRYLAIPEEGSPGFEEVRG